MDKTLADYISRITNLEKEKLQPQEQTKHENNNYEIYPEPQSIDSDEKRNPYSKV